MTNVFHDWEFFEDGKTIEPISVGITTDDGKSLYYIFEDATFLAHRNKFLKNHVWPHIEHEVVSESPIVKSKHYISEHIKEFMAKIDAPVLWAYYGAYDHVSLAQRFGPMIDMPNHIPWVTHDITTLEHLCKLRVPAPDEFTTQPPKQDPKTEHHALYDALHDADLFKYYMERLNRG